MVCPYCNNPAALVTGREVYPGKRWLYGKSFYLCGPCDAYVGCHDGTTKPLGRLANAELRAAKIAAHAAFDPLWQSGRMKRQEAYGWLADQLKIAREHCHIGMFDVETCRLVVAIIKWG